MSKDDERRGAERYTLDRPCKVRSQGAVSLHGAVLEDVSASGARLRLTIASHLEPGQRVELYVDWDRAGVCLGPSTATGLIVRAESSEPGGTAMPSFAGCESCGLCRRASEIDCRATSRRGVDAASTRIAVAFERLIELRPDVIGSQVREDHWSWSRSA